MCKFMYMWVCYEHIYVQVYACGNAYVCTYVLCLCACDQRSATSEPSTQAAQEPRVCITSLASHALLSGVLTLPEGRMPGTLYYLGNCCHNDNSCYCRCSC